MNRDFQCTECSAIFLAEGYKKQWNHPIYGPQEGYKAESPCCNKESGEYVKPKSGKESASTSMPSGCAGGCCGCPHSM